MRFFFRGGNSRRIVVDDIWPRQHEENRVAGRVEWGLRAGEYFIMKPAWKLAEW